MAAAKHILIVPFAAHLQFQALEYIPADCKISSFVLLWTSVRAEVTRTIATAPTPGRWLLSACQSSILTLVEILGKVGNRQILYTNIIADKDWFKKLPVDNWFVFTIGDEVNSEFESKVVYHCLDNNVGYACSAGQLAGSTKLEFDLEIVNRAIEMEDKTGKEYDYGASPLTSFDKNIGEGFWFVTSFANDPYKDVTRVVCVDFTVKGVKKYLKVLLEKINNGWVPDDEETEGYFCDSPA